MAVFRRIVPYLKPYRRQLIIDLSALGVALPLTLFHPLVWMFITDEVALNGKLNLLLPALSVMIGAHLLGTALSALHRNLLEKVGQRFVVDLRLAVYEKLQRHCGPRRRSHRRNTGNHDELMARRGLYHEMYTLQVGHLSGVVGEPTG